MAKYQFTTKDEKTTEIEADVVRNEGAFTVFYKEGSIIKMVPVESIVNLEVVE